ncbi:MAG: ABC transporter ATP-binding protein, partial [Frankiales bacterium]|nr:ABC transporter ATP-binding protein [Frankiales bacterium]
KSTLLRCVAGLADATGTVTVDGAELAALPAHRRPVGWVPQDGALFPHLSALDNVAYSLGGRRGRSAAARWLELVGVADLARRRPGGLSGGQAQKVALARALARRPRLLLLDEPMAALDTTARADARRTLRRHLDEFDGVTLLVTHDPVDVATLASRTLALEDGRVVQDARPAEVARAPRTPWLAGWIGVNALRGVQHGRSLDLDDGGRLAAAEASDSDRDVLAVVPAHAVSLHRLRPSGSARNAWPVVVQELVAAGARVRVHCTGPPDVVAEVTAEAVADLELREGADAWAAVKATEITVVPL